MTSKSESMTGEEALSALVDGELDALSRNRILGRLVDDPDLRARWARYHAGRASLEGAAPDLVGAGFSERVAAAVSAEPAIVAPRRPRAARRSFRDRPAAAIAAAAVVAMVAVGGLFAWLDGATESSAPVVTERGSGTSAGSSGDGAPLVSGSFGEGLTPGQQDRVRQRLAMYLNSHNRFADAGEMPTVMPSSRLVAFNAGP